MTVYNKIQRKKRYTICILKTKVVIPRSYFTSLFLFPLVISIKKKGVIGHIYLIEVKGENFTKGNC